MAKGSLFIWSRGVSLRSVDDYQSPTQRWGHSLSEESRGRMYPRKIEDLSQNPRWRHIQHQHHGQIFHIIWIISKAYNESRQVWLLLLLSPSGSWIADLIQLTCAGHLFWFLLQKMAATNYWIFDRQVLKLVIISLCIICKYYLVIRFGIQSYYFFDKLLRPRTDTSLHW